MDLNEASAPERLSDLNHELASHQFLAIHFSISFHMNICPAFLFVSFSSLGLPLNTHVSSTAQEILVVMAPEHPYFPTFGRRMTWGKSLQIPHHKLLRKFSIVKADMSRAQFLMFIRRWGFLFFKMIARAYTEAANVYKMLKRSIPKH